MQIVKTDISVGQMTIKDVKGSEILPVNDKVALNIGDEYTITVPVSNKSLPDFPSMEIPVKAPLGVCFKTYFNTSGGATISSTVKEDNPEYNVYPLPTGKAVWFYKKEATPAEYEGEIKVKVIVDKLDTWFTCQHLISNNNPDAILADTKSDDNSTSLQY